MSVFRSFAVIPAAGHSRRMGRPKLRLPWKHSTVIESVLSAWKASRVERIVAVVRREDSELQALCRAAGVELCLPDPAPLEMKHSIQAGLRFWQDQAAPDRDDAWLMAPADMPELSPVVIDRLLETFAEERSRPLVPRDASGRRGHPALFPWRLAEEVERLSENQGVKAILQTHPPREVLCEQAERSFQDLDTPEDYRRMTELGP